MGSQNNHLNNRNKVDSIGSKDNKNSIIQTIILSLSLGLLIYLTIMNMQLSKRIEGVEQFNEKLLSNIEQNTKSRVTQLLDKLSEQLANNIDKTTQSLNTVAQNKLDQSLGDISENLNKSANATINLANSKIIRNEEQAEEALKLAKKYIQSDNFEVARIYLLNAINHSPTKLKYLSELLTLFQNHYTSNQTAINEFRSVFELSLFQLDPKEINEAIKYISELDNAAQKLIDPITETSIETTNWSEEYLAVKNGDLNEISTDPDKLLDRINKLTIILSNIRNSDKETDQYLSSIQDDIDTTQNYYSLSIVAKKIENYIMLLEKEVNYASQVASARLLAASSSMSVFWQYDLNQLPSKLAILIQNELPNKLRDFEDKINEAKSLPIFEKTNKILVDTSNNESGTYQDKIDREKKAIEIAINLMRNITFRKFQDEIRNNIIILQKNITFSKRQQFIAYQKWASEVCSDVFDSIDDEYSLSDDDAIRIFYNSELSEIDLRLASPEVSQAYNKVLQKILGELPGKKAFKIQKTLMTSDKKKMEDF